MDKVDPRAVVVAGLCVYETFAIVTGKAPTLTSLAWQARKHTAGRIAIWNVVGYLAWHLMVEEAKLKAEEAAGE